MTDSAFRFGDVADELHSRGGFPLHDLLPIVPPGATLGANTKLKADHLGKVPGVYHNGVWTGLTGTWPTLGLSPRDIERAADWPTHNVGLRAADWPAIDCDVNNEKIMAWLAKHLRQVLGDAPARKRSNSPRSLFVYCRAPGETIHKMKLDWTDRDGEDHTIEVLGEGQQYVINGMHPSGVLYEWEAGVTLADVTASGLTFVTDEQLRDFLTSFAEDVIPRTGGTVTRLSLPGRGSGAQGQGVAVNDLEPVVDPDLALAALRSFKNDRDTVPAREQIVSIASSFKAALGREADQYRDKFTEWATADGWADDAYIDHIWESLPYVKSNVDVLFGYARKYGGWHGDAALDFAAIADGKVDKKIEQAQEQQQTDAQARLKEVAAQLVYHEETQRWIVLDTGTPLSHSALGNSTLGTKIAKAGSAGKNSASSKLVNSGLVRLVAGKTFLPGKEKLVKWKRNGHEGLFYNTWTDVHPMPTHTVRDSDVQPWLDHMAYLFPDVSERDTLIDWMAHTVQHRGKKIRWAPIIIGDQGVGKDMAVRPLAKFFDHNFQEVPQDRLFSRFNDYLESELIVVQELSRFDKIESYEKLKAMIAGTAGDSIIIERKFEAPYAIPNVSNYMFFSNHDDALKLESDDRRFFVIKTTVKKKDPSYFAKLVDDFYGNKKGWLGVAKWLQQRDVSRFNIHQCPEATAAKREMIASQGGYFPTWLQDQLDSGRWQHRTVVTASELFKAIQEDMMLPLSQNVRISVKNGGYVSRALKHAGWRNVNKNVRINGINGGQPVTVWVRTDNLCDLDATQLRDICEQEMNKQPTQAQKEFADAPAEQSIKRHH